MLVDKSLFCSGGKQGLCIKYIPQICIARDIAMTPSFIRKHKVLAAVITHFVDTAESRWRAIAST